MQQLRGPVAAECLAVQLCGVGGKYVCKGAFVHAGEHADPAVGIGCVKLGIRPADAAQKGSQVLGDTFLGHVKGQPLQSEPGKAQVIAMAKVFCTQFTGGKAMQEVAVGQVCAREANAVSFSRGHGCLCLQQVCGGVDGRLSAGCRHKGMALRLRAALLLQICAALDGASIESIHGQNCRTEGDEHYKGQHQQREVCGTDEGKAGNSRHNGENGKQQLQHPGLMSTPGGYAFGLLAAG